MLSRNAKRTVLGLSVAAIAVVLFAATVRHYFAARALEIRLEQERAELVPAEPLLVEVQRRDLTRERTYAVKLAPFRRTRVAAEASGRVAEVPFELGDTVSEGQVLARLDDTLARLNLETAEASLEAAEVQVNEFQRRLREAEDLAASRAIPETQVEAARSQLEVQRRDVARLRSEVNRQRELLARHEVRAPFSGVIDRRLVEPGDTVSLNEPIAILTALDPLRARFFVSDQELSAFGAGQEIAIRLDSNAGQMLASRITSISRTADPETGLFTIETSIPNPEGTLPGGLQGTANVEVRRYTDTLFVPAAAIRFEGKHALASVRRNGVSEPRQVRLGPELDDYYPVIEGLSEGERVVIE